MITNTRIQRHPRFTVEKATWIEERKAWFCRMRLVNTQITSSWFIPLKRVFVHSEFVVSNVQMVQYPIRYFRIMISGLYGVTHAKTTFVSFDCPADRELMRFYMSLITDGNDTTKSHELAS